jgi:hypothetical protein
VSGPSESLETCGLQAQMLALEVSPLHGVHLYSVSILVTLGVCVLNEGDSSVESVQKRVLCCLHPKVPFLQPLPCAYKEVMELRRASAKLNIGSVVCR